MSSFTDKLNQKGLSPKTIEAYTKVVNQVGKKDPIKWLNTRVSASTPIGTILPFRSAIKHYLISEKGLSPEEADKQLPKCKGLPCKLRDSLSEDQLVLFKEKVQELTNPTKTILLLLPVNAIILSAASLNDIALPAVILKLLLFSIPNAHLTIPFAVSST